MLLAAIFISYYPVTHNEFLGLDDVNYIVQNAHIKDGLAWSTVAWAFTTYDEANWHPLTWLSHALDCQLFGLNPAGAHWMNVFFHAVNAVLLFVFLQISTRSRWRSLMVAALFALHPINVESVAWAAERKTVLSTMFFLLAFCAYVRYSRDRTLRRYSIASAFYALALLAKPQVITFPFLLLLWDYWPLNRMSLKLSSAESPNQLPFRQLLREKIPFFLLSAISAVVTMRAQSAGGAVRDLAHYGVLLRIETSLIAYARYLAKAFWPSHLVALYPHPTRPYPTWQIFAAAILLFLITAIVLRARQQRYLAMGWFWFLGSLFPMIGLVQVGEQELADRYAYISFIGLFVMVVWLLADLAEGHLSSDSEAKLAVSPRWLAVPALLCLVALSVVTHRQVFYWHDTESFWRRTAALTKNNYVALKGLAGILHTDGKTEEAIAQVRAVLAIRPEDAAGYLLLGDYEHERGNLPAAAEQYQLAAERGATAGQRAKALADLGFTYGEMGYNDKAKNSFETSLQVLPGQPSMLIQLGLIAHVSGDYPTAIRQYSHAMKLQPSDVGFLLLARALQQDGHADRAEVMRQRAARISSNFPQAEKQAAALLGGH